MKRTSLSTIAIWMLAVLYLILPTYFSFEISDMFPSFTGSRIVLILATVFLIIENGGKIEIPNQKSMRIIVMFIFVMTVIDCVHLNDSLSYSIKDIFSMILEQLLLIIVIWGLIKSKDDLVIFIKMMVVVSAIVFFFALLEFLTGYNVFYLLTTTSRTVYQASYVRSGMTRAEASFGHSVYYGVYCSCMLPFSMYLYEKERRGVYLLIAGLNIFGVLISGARGQMITVFLLIFLMLIKKRSTAKSRYFLALICIAIIIAFIGIMMPSVFEYILDNVKSILNALGFNFDLSSSYGTNINGYNSRIIQFTGIQWIYENGKLLFGFGPLASSRGLIKNYYVTTGWQTITSVDVGYVGWILDYGIIGAIVSVILYGYVFKIVLKGSNEMEDDNLWNPFKWFVAAYLLNLLSTSGLSSMWWLVVGLIIAYQKICDEESINVSDTSLTNE